MDNYDPLIYDEAFYNVCATHAHVIPTHDYAVHRNAVNKAIRDVVGPITGQLLRSLMAWRNNASGMPSAQAMLLWIKDTKPHLFREVLERARQCQYGAVPESTQ
jgi:hypothetical protein